MELNDDIIAIQGILSSVVKTTGEFTKINYKGGNEQKILQVTNEIQNFLCNRNYIKNDSDSPSNEKKLEDILLFLAINTRYKKSLELEECAHLMNITPQLSLCLFVNVIYGLHSSKVVCKCYGKAIEKLPLDNIIEIIEETHPSLKSTTPTVLTEYSYIFLKIIADKLHNPDVKEDKEGIRKLNEISNILLQNMTGLYSGQTKNLKILEVRKHMGYRLMYFFDLLLYCDKNKLILKKFISNILTTCCMILRNVTLNVYCSWAEIQENDQPLQSVIAEKAYLVTEYYQNYEDAKELLGMLVTIARKPKTLAELIHEADVETIIRKINNNDKDQKHWFQALLNTQISNDDETITCVKKYAHLCNENDIERLLKLSLQSNNTELINLTISCASKLELKKLILISTRYFHEHRFENVLNENVLHQLIKIFNQMVTVQTDEEVKEIFLMLLQNPKAVLDFIYDECLKNIHYSGYLRKLFFYVKDIAKIDDIGVNILNNVVSRKELNDNFINNLIEILTTLQRLCYFSYKTILFKIILPLLEKSYTTKNFLNVRLVLELILGPQIKIKLNEESENLLKILMNIMSECRGSIYDFNFIKHENADCVVHILTELCEVDPEYVFKVEYDVSDDKFTAYYKKYLSSEAGTFFNTFFEKFQIETYGVCVAKLLEVLPFSVEIEWLQVSDEICRIYDREIFVEILTDALVFFCQILEIEQVHEDSVGTRLRYCFHKYGLILKEKILKNSTINVQIKVAKEVCRLIRTLPDCFKEELGLPLISILTTRSLKQVGHEKDFVFLVTSIGNAIICKTIANKITS